jgi:surfactin synthase thioesterase subunit
VSATDAPARRDGVAYSDVRTDADLIATLRRLGGTAPEVLDNAELLELTLPVVRADFALCSGPAQRTRERLTCPIRVLYGTRDTLTIDSLETWRAETSASFAMDGFDGDHFFLASHVELVASRIAHHLRALKDVPEQPLATPRA